MTRTDLPDGVDLLPLKKHADDRGWVSEVFRRDRVPGQDPCQWNVTVSQPNVLRGMHVHARHRDYLVVVQGKLSVALFDIRPESPTYRSGTVLSLAEDGLSALRLPVGVLHGFYSPEQAVYIYGLDTYFDPRDEMGCHWRDPAIKLNWPVADPVLSERDRCAGTLIALEAQFQAARLAAAG
jgi:dTDP-4-dehydrorhamnose 3,5-epimerase